MQDDLTNGNADNAFHVTTADYVGELTVINGFTITAGNADAGDPDKASLTDPNDSGAGMFAEFGVCAITIDNCVFLNNSADMVGGAIVFSRFNGAPRVTNCSFRSNSAHTGGGIYTHNAETGYDNCLFTGNFASFSGGAIYFSSSRSFSSSSSIYTMTNCTFQGNASETLGGGTLELFVGSTDVMANCIIWNNKAPNPAKASIVLSRGDPIFSNCLIEGYNPGGTNLDGTLPENNPLFLSEIDPGDAPTSAMGNHLFPEDSPAHNAGDNSASTELTDIIGRPRLSGGTVDLGAYERQGILYVDAGVVGGSGDGSSWANAYSELQSALQNPASEIWVAEGDYYPDEGTGQTNGDRGSTFGLSRGLSIYGGFPAGGGDGSIDARDPFNFVSTLSGDLGQNDDTSGNGDNAFHVVTGSGTDTSTLIDGFTITAGNAFGAEEPDSAGGGFYAKNGALIISNSSFTSNHSRIFGGALFCAFGDSKIVNCAFLGNSTELLGGAVYLRFCSPTFTNCAFQGNKSDILGGALYNSAASSPSLINCSFQGNWAALNNGGGAIYNTSASAPALRNTVIWNNRTGSTTSSTSASIHSGVPVFSHSLVDNINPAGTNNLDGTDDANNPQFFLEVDPVSAPTVAGNLRQTGASPLTNRGDNSVNPETVDLAGDLRIRDGVIDIGAYEAITTVHLTIRVETLPENGTDIGFSILGPDFPTASSFILDDETTQTDAIEQAIIFENLQSGTYEIAEILPAGWSLDEITCSGGADSGSLDGETLTIDIAPGEDITCTFTNALSHYLAWVRQYYPNETDLEIIGFTSDPNSDGWINGLMFLLAGSASEYLPSILPTQALDGTYMITEYGRSDRLGTISSALEYGTDMVNWTTAIDGEDGVIIEIEDDGFGFDAGGFGIDKVVVKIPYNDEFRFFYQLVVE